MTDINYSDLQSIIENTTDVPRSELENSIKKILKRTGLYYRIFSRTKSYSSLERKMKYKDYSETKKLQDIFGLRIILYFKDDVPICRKIITETCDVVDVSEDVEEMETFKPIRLNMVCRIGDEIKKDVPEELFSDFPIDDTFEIQIRTVLSEGWHEVEHDLRYKCQEEWNGLDESSRILNGIFATLETCDWSIISLCNNLAYTHYKDRNWEAMIRNKFRLRIDGKISPGVLEVIENDADLAKALYRIDRQQLIGQITRINIPITFDNAVFIANSIIKNEKLNRITPELIQSKLSSLTQ